MSLVLQAENRLDLTPVEVSKYFDWYSVPTRRAADKNIKHLMKYLIKCAGVYGIKVPKYAEILSSKGATLSKANPEPKDKKEKPEQDPQPQGAGSPTIAPEEDAPRTSAEKLFPEGSVVKVVTFDEEDVTVDPLEDRDDMLSHFAEHVGKRGQVIGHEGEYVHVAFAPDHSHLFHTDELINSRLDHGSRKGAEPGDQREVGEPQGDPAPDQGGRVYRNKELSHSEEDLGRRVFYISERNPARVGHIVHYLGEGASGAMYEMDNGEVINERKIHKSMRFGVNL